MGFLTGLLASLFTSLLQMWLERADFRARVLQEARSDGLQAALAALEWKTGAIARPDGGSALRVLSDTPIVLSDTPSSIECPNADCPLRARRPEG